MSELPTIEPVQRKKRAPKRPTPPPAAESLPDINSRQPAPPSVEITKQPGEKEQKNTQNESEPKKRKVAGGAASKPPGGKQPQKAADIGVDIDGKFKELASQMRNDIHEKVWSSREEVKEVGRNTQARMELLQKSTQELGQNMNKIYNDLTDKHEKLLEYFEKKRESKEQRLKEEKEKELYERLKYGSHTERHSFAWPSSNRNYY